MQSGSGLRLILVAVVASLALLPGRQSEAARGEHAPGCLPATTASKASPAGLAASSNSFGFGLLATLLGGHPATNTFISPASVSLALDMTYEGARRETAMAMARTLNLSGLSRAAVRSRAAALLQRLQAPNSQSGLVIANSLWARKGVRFQAAFMRNVQHDYGARVQALDFASPRATSTINTWVSCATGGKISGIIDRIPPSIILYLINAVYFHGDWASPFNPANTRQAAFTLSGGRQIQVPLMSRTGSYPYYKGSNFQAIRLPYTGGRFSMVLLAPNDGTAPGTFSRQLNLVSWKRWASRMRQMEGQISMPRFSLQNTFGLNGPLSSMGMGLAFTDDADFTGMCLPNCRISDVRHKTFLAVNEKGTVAAGVTSVGMEPTAMPQIQFKMTLDHPFFVTIEDRQTGSILFTGFIANPAA